MPEGVDTGKTVGKTAYLPDPIGALEHTAQARHRVIPTQFKCGQLARMETKMFFAYCATACPFADYTPQTVDLPDAVARRIRLSAKGLERARAMCAGVEEVDWDVSESSSPIVLTHTFPHWTGRCERVETREGDDVFYARVDHRGRWPIWGRFVRNRRGEMTRSQTIVLRPVGEEPYPTGWRIVAAYVGEPAPPFPGDRFAAYDDAVAYWATHALVDGAVPYRKGTETRVCPW